MASAYTLGQSQLAAAIAANDSSYPRQMFSPGKMAIYVNTAAELAALPAGWFPHVVSE